MRESFKKSESEGSKPGFYDHQQTALKEFMVFNTNSVILPHIIEQALRQRALLQETQHNEAKSTPYPLSFQLNVCPSSSSSCIKIIIPIVTAIIARSVHDDDDGVKDKHDAKINHTKQGRQYIQLIHSGLTTLELTTSRQC